MWLHLPGDGGGAHLGLAGIEKRVEEGHFGGGEDLVYVSRPFCQGKASISLLLRRRGSSSLCQEKRSDTRQSYGAQKAVYPPVTSTDEEDTGSSNIKSGCSFDEESSTTEDWFDPPLLDISIWTANPTPSGAFKSSKADMLN